MEGAGGLPESTARRTAALEQPGFGLVLDLGRQRRKHIARLKSGTGKLRTRLDSVVSHARARYGLADDVEIVPVVVLYRITEEEPVLAQAIPLLEDGRD